MGKSFAVTGFCVIVAVASLTRAAEDDLFSSVRTESVFAPSADVPATIPPARRSNPLPELEIKIGSTGELARKLRQAGFEVEETEQLWSFNTTQAATLASQPAKPPKVAPSLAGKWVAVRSANEAFAVQFNADGTFLLAYVNKGQQTRTTGKFTHSGQELTFAGSGGFRLAGTVSKQTDKEFRFQPSKSAAGTNGLVFKRAK